MILASKETQKPSSSTLSLSPQLSHCCPKANSHHSILFKIPSKISLFQKKLCALHKCKSRTGWDRSNWNPQIFLIMGNCHFMQSPVKLRDFFLSETFLYFGQGLQNYRKDGSACFMLQSSFWKLIRCLIFAALVYFGEDPTKNFH